MRHSLLKYWQAPYLVNDANEIARCIESGEFAAARLYLMALNNRCRAAGFTSVAASASRAARALESRQSTGSVGAELFTLAEAIENALARG